MGVVGGIDSVSIDSRFVGSGKLKEEVFKTDDETKKLRVHVYSDVHLSHIPHMQSHADNFALALKSLNKKIEKANANEEYKQYVLVLNGDFLDFLEAYAWEYGKLPYHDGEVLDNQENNSELLQKIIQQPGNDRVFDELKKFLQFPNTRLFYIYGNHDHLLKLDDNLREDLTKAFGFDNADAAKDKITFADSLKFPELALHAEHGHRIDKFDYVLGDKKVPWGDWLALMKVSTLKGIYNRLSELIGKGIDQNTFDKMLGKVMKIEYIRDAKLFPAYIKHLAHSLKQIFDLDSQVKKAVSDKVTEAFVDMARFIRRSPFLGRLGGITPEGFLKSPVFMWLMARAVNFIYHQQTHKNTLQLDEAEKIAHKDPHYTTVTMGHTHKEGRMSKLAKINNKDRRIILYNSGTAMNSKGVLSIDLDSVDFDQTEKSTGGLVFKLNKESENAKRIKAEYLSAPRTSYYVNGNGAKAVAA